MEYARPELLAEPDWLAEHADDSQVRDHRLRDD